MNKLLSLAAAIGMAAFIGGSSVIGEESADAIRQMQTEMLYTTVRVKARGGTGSGTIIYSRKRFNTVYTYILTNYHVISSSIRREVTPATEDTPRILTESRYLVNVEIFSPSKLGAGTRITTETSEIVAYDKYRDLAILRLGDHENINPYVAAIADEGEGLEVFEQAFAVGAGLGMVPYPTEGRISIVESIIENLPYVVSSAQIIFGNSGGGLYTWDVDRYELVGVPNKIRVIGMGSVVSHVALSIPMDDVYYFLRSTNLGFITEARKA